PGPARPHARLRPAHPGRAAAHARHRRHRARPGLLRRRAGGRRHRPAVGRALQPDGVPPRRSVIRRSCVRWTMAPFPARGRPMHAVSTATRELVELGRQTLVPTYRQRELILERGQGATLWDIDGRDYIDFAAGIAVNALGCGDPAILAALQEQAAKLWHTSNIFYSEPPLRLADELVAASGFARRVFFCNSGAEANEAAIKLARRWAAQQGRAPERRTLLTFEGSFHGRTLATVTATAQPKYQAGFEPLPGGFRYARYNDTAAFDAAF